MGGSRLARQACADTSGCGRPRHRRAGRTPLTRTPLGRTPPRRRRQAGLLAVIPILWLAGCAPASAPDPHSVSPAATSGSRLEWMATRWALSQLMADPEVEAGLRGALIYEILQPGQQPRTGPGAVPTVTFSAAGTLASAVTRRQLPAGTRAVLYDPEAWAFTPAADQRDPAGAAARAARVARARHLKIIIAPALNLTTVLRPGGARPRWRQFLDLRLPAEFARHADILEIQAQSLERDTRVYADFVTAAAEQARAANPRVIVLAGLSTNPPGAPVDSQQLVAAIQATRRSVNGYWLNIPGPGPRCPTCNPARPHVGVMTLRAVL